MPDNVEMEKVWLIGTGSIAPDYAKALTAQGAAFTVVGRGEASAKAFTEKTGLPVATGGVAKALEIATPEAAIVAVGVFELADVACSLLKNGVKRILLEKPGGGNRQDIASVAEAAATRGADVRIAYNRRFYASTLAAQQYIAQDGGVASFNFEFTEWLHVFRAMPAFNEATDIFLGNSTHVMDLAFFLGGSPGDMTCYARNDGRLLSEGSSRIYAGAGVSDKGALFSYQANWNAPGRWGVEVLTRKHRLIFRPMEQLHMQKIGSVAIERVDIDDSLDVEFKPGLYREVEAFLTGKNIERLPDIREQLAHCSFYEKMQSGA